MKREDMEAGRDAMVGRSVSILIIFSLLVLAIHPLPGAHAQGTASATVDPPNVLLNYQLSLRENLTALSPAKVFLDSSNSSALLSSMQTAMRQKVPSVSLDTSTFRYFAIIRQQSPGSNTWVISENFTGTVKGSDASTGSAMSFNLAFLAMNMSDPVQYGGVEFNNVGNTYLVPTIDLQGRTTTFYLDRDLIRGGPYLNPVIPGNTTERFNLLDFSWVPKISDWPQHTYRPLDASSSWTLDPKKDNPGLPYNLTITAKSPGGEAISSLTAVYDVVLQLSGPARATATGYMITNDISTIWDFIMPIVIIIVVALGLVAVIAERRIAKPRQVAYRKKQSQRRV